MQRLLTVAMVAYAAVACCCGSMVMRSHGSALVESIGPDGVKEGHCSYSDTDGNQIKVRYRIEPNQSPQYTVELGDRSVDPAVVYRQCTDRQLQSKYIAQEITRTASLASGHDSNRNVPFPGNSGNLPQFPFLPDLHTLLSLHADLNRRTVPLVITEMWASQKVHEQLVQQQRQKLQQLEQKLQQQKQRAEQQKQQLDHLELQQKVQQQRHELQQLEQKLQQQEQRVELQKQQLHRLKQQIAHSITGGTATTTTTTTARTTDVPTTATTGTVDVTETTPAELNLYSGGIVIK